VIEQRSPEWYKERLGHATASEADAVMAEGKGGGEAVTRRNYKMRLACERLTGRPAEESFSNRHTDRGEALEPFARAAYCTIKDVLVTQLGFVKHPTILWVGASPDSEADPKGGLEIKCPIAAIHVAYLTSGFPSTYRKQVQWQLWCKPEWEWVDFVSYNQDVPEKIRTFIQRVPRDDKFIAEIEQKTIPFLREVEEVYLKLEALCSKST